MAWSRGSSSLGVRRRGASRSSWRLYTPAGGVAQCDAARCGAITVRLPASHAPGTVPSQTRGLQAWYCGGMALLCEVGCVRPPLKADGTALSGLVSCQAVSPAHCRRQVGMTDRRVGAIALLRAGSVVRCGEGCRPASPVPASVLVVSVHRVYYHEDHRRVRFWVAREGGRHA